MSTIIRPIQPSDAEAFTALLAVLDTETKFLLYEPGERTTTATEWRARIEAMQAEGVSEMFVAVDDTQPDSLAGFMRAGGTTQMRLRHIVYLVIGIRQAYAGQGIGTRLFETMEAWARARGLHRLQLNVAGNNERVIALYRKMGFEIEGLHRHAVYVDGHYVDDYTMAKLLE